LVTDPNQHLEQSDLAKLLEELGRRPEGGELELAELHPHLPECAACCERLESLAIEGGWRNIRVSRLGSRKADCPAEEVWDQVAGGLVEPDQTLRYIEHASRCDHCGPLLRTAVEVFVDPTLDLAKELSEAERTQIAGLESTRPEWQMRLAERISGTTRASRSRQASSRQSSSRQSWWRRWFSVPALAGAGITAALIAGGLWLRWDSRVTPEAANRLLARAYTDQRTLELRIPGAAYGPLRVQRGPAESFTARPAPLLKAEALIASRLAAHPDDPGWLEAAARADVLEGKYDAAVESLQRALELQPHSADAMFELATAHFQRAQSEDRQEDYAAAFEYLSDVLAQQPENAPALFNRAIVAEHEFLYRQALDDWERYLKLDSTSQWAEEARNRAEAVRVKLKEHESGAKPLLTPEQVASSANGDVERRVEQYLDAAVRSWLPQAYPEAGSGDSNAQHALFFLADLTSQKHKDRWFSDLLAGSSDPRFPRAAAALARSSKANDSGDYSAGREQAGIALQLFRASGNQAGVLRAKFEQAFSGQMTRQTADCRRDATGALALAEELPYAWLQIQLGLEKAVCSLLGEDDWGGDERISRRAKELARQSGYDSLYLRALYFVADDQVRTGDLSGGLKSVAEALGRYWSAEIPAYRGYNLYDLLGSTPEFVRNRPHFVTAVWREGTALADLEDNPLSRAWAHSSAARAAAELHEPGVAQREYAEAARYFVRAPQTEALHDYLIGNEIQTAGVEGHLGQLDSGIARLTRIQNLLQPRSNKYVEEEFYATLGELELQNHHAALAEQAFRPALESAERRLHSLNSEAERISWSKEAAPVYLGMAEAELVQGRAEESLSYFEWHLGAAVRAGKSGRSEVDASGVAPDPTWLSSRLPLLSDRTVIAYAALPDGLAIWTYDNRGIHAQWIPQSNQDLRELAARFYDLASDPESETAALRRDSRSLYRALVAPVEERLDPGRTLVVEADGWLAQVPFKALLDANEHYLIERAPIVQSLGQSIDASLHRDAAISPNQRTLIVASTASYQAEGLVPLPDVAAEAEAVARDFPSATILKGSQATLAAVEEELPSTSIFHFTGHSLARPTGAALMLGASSPQKNAAALVDADLLRRLDLHNLQLAVLSTCNTASADDARGFNRIAETLQRAGVPHVIASQWAVDSAVSKQFVEDFYRSTLSGRTVSEAIRQTSRNMMANPRTSHPYYWSAFSAYGRP
jgi:CHAT domain-containing protein/tetratricopeptide (TPR) repeat protein